MKDPANRPAAHQVWTIATSLLYDIGAAVVVYGLVLVVATWLAGHTRPAKALRRALAPTLRDRPAVAYIAVYAVLLLVIIWGPTPATRQLRVHHPLHRAAGRRVSRRSVVRPPTSFPTRRQATPRGRSAPGTRSDAGRRRANAAAGCRVPCRGDRVADLERLASLHDRGSLTDEEFVAEKAALTNGA